MVTKMVPRFCVSLFGLLFIFPAVQCVLKKSSQCSKSQGCISNPEATVMLTWRPTSQLVHFTLRGYIGSGDMYLAMGLSADEIMGDDDVIECVHTGGRVRVHSSYNLGKTNVRYIDGGLRNESGLYEHGVIECSFSRPQDGQGPLTQGSVSPPVRHDLHHDWYIMLAWGHLEPGSDKKERHIHRSVSSHEVSLRKVGSFMTRKLSDILINVHGSVMMIAWVTVTSIGVIIARHYKGLLPGTKFWGKDVWFQVHRSLMVLTSALTVLGTIVIFVEVGGYREITHGTSMIDLLHPILGLIVTALAVLNPITALFRPVPNSPRRPVFNWAHRFIGTGAQFIAVATMFLGMLMTKVLAPVTMLAGLGAFVAWHIVIEILFFGIVYTRIHKAERLGSVRSYTIQEKQEAAEHRPHPPKVSSIQEILLMMHSAVAIATAVFLITVLLSKTDH
ncbi:hypothetical protein ACOMHN_015710 [Nucella lapillus]